MSDKKIIFSTGEITYDDEWYHENGLSVKPVKYTTQFLKNIASQTMGSSLELTHGNKTHDVIGYVNDYDFTDDNLLGIVATNEDTANMGYSPEFEANFIDKGSCYEAVDGKLLKVIMTDKPRSHILCNSVEGGSNMNEELIDTFNSQIKDLNKQNAILETKLKANEAKLEKYDLLIEENEKLKSEISNYKSQVDGLKPKADAYAKIEESRRESLLTEAFGDDEESKKVWKDAPMDYLENLAKHREVYRQANGIGANNGEGIGEGEDDDESTPDIAGEALAYYKKTHNGEEPSFLKQEGGE